MRYGAIYIAHNPRDGQTVFKVGKTERSVAERMADLTADTSNLGKYVPVAYFVVTDIDAAEAACHRRLARYRVQQNREFFDLPLARLVPVVREVTAPFKAADLVPDLAPAEDPVPLSPAEKLQAARAEQETAQVAWKDALVAAEATVAEWSEETRQRARRAAEELAEVDVAKWEFPTVEPKSPRPMICKVTVYAKFQAAPVLLDMHGLSGKPWGEPDLSRAVGQPQVDHSFGVKFLSWREPDDGRVGKVSIYSRVDHAGPEHPDRLPVAKLCVRASHLRYDDYRRGFETRQAERCFTDPQEAFDVFLDLVVVNVRDVQYDVRAEAGTYKGRRKINDRSKFNLDALKDSV